MEQCRVSVLVAWRLTRFAQRLDPTRFTETIERIQPAHIALALYSTPSLLIDFARAAHPTSLSQENEMDRHIRRENPSRGIFWGCYCKKNLRYWTLRPDL